MNICDNCGIEDGAHVPERFNCGVGIVAAVHPRCGDMLCQHCSYELFITRRAGINKNPDDHSGAKADNGQLDMWGE